MSPVVRRAIASCPWRLSGAAVLLAVGSFLLPAAASADQGACFDAGCTANDFSQIQVVVSIVGGDDCGDGFLDLELDWTVTRQGAGASRFDIGFWVPIDGLDARDGGNTCEKTAVLSDVDVYFQDDADECRDFPSGPTQGDFTQFATVACDNGTAADRIMCLSWDNQEADNCDVDLDLLPGTPSKCQCVLASLGGPSEPVPTVSEMGLAALGVLLLAAGAVALRRGGLV